ncbi:MAG: hypothetical protein ACLTCB_07830 [Merdibacter sp.]
MEECVRSWNAGSRIWDVRHSIDDDMIPSVQVKDGRLEVKGSLHAAAGRS